MKRVKLTFTVLIIESDSWSGQKVLARKVYKVRSAAERYIAKHNGQNNLPTTPEYYTYACFETDLVTR